MYRFYPYADVRTLSVMIYSIQRTRETLLFSIVNMFPFYSGNVLEDVQRTHA